MVAHSIFRLCEAFPHLSGLQPSWTGLPEHYRRSHLPGFSSAHPTFLMREQVILPRGCHLPPPRHPEKTSHGAITAGHTCKAPQGPDAEWHTQQGFPAISICCKDHWLFLWPLCRGHLLSLQVAWSVERPWTLTYHCPLLASGHEHIPSPQSSSLKGRG